MKQLETSTRPAAVEAGPTPRPLPEKTKAAYVLRRIGARNLSAVLPAAHPSAGDVLLCRVESIGRNKSLELIEGRRSDLFPGDTIACALGNRYATRQFEAYAECDGDACDLVSLGGLCGRVRSKYATAKDPTRLTVLGAIGDRDGKPLRLRDHALPPAFPAARPRVVAVCGSSMDTGKTHAVMSVVRGLRRTGAKVAAIKLTGTATGNDSWVTVDAGADVCLNFIDGGWPSTYMCGLSDLLALNDLLIGHAASNGARWAVVEIADGVLQGETAALLGSDEFRAQVDHWVFATGDPLAAVGGVSVLSGFGIRPIAVSGLVSLSPLCVREVEEATGLRCLTSEQIQTGALDEALGVEVRA